MSDPAADDVVKKIDTLTAAGPTTSDIDPDSLEARLRLLCPGHTFWTRKPAVPDLVAAAAHHFGRPLPDDVPVSVKGIWTFPDGAWVVTFYLCDEGDGRLYHLDIDGPDTELHRSPITAADAVELLTSVGALRSP